MTRSVSVKIKTSKEKLPLALQIVTCTKSSLEKKGGNVILQRTDAALVNLSNLDVILISVMTSLMCKSSVILMMKKYPPVFSFAFGIIFVV